VPVENALDVNGTKFHLLYGCEDWGGCSLEGTDGTIQSLWDSVSPAVHPPLEWDCDMASLRLAREVPLFRRQTDSPPLDVLARRGAGRDRYGNWYWIDEQESGIRCLRNSTYDSVSFWGSDTQATHASLAQVVDKGLFAARLARPARPAAGKHVLRGLAVTMRNYLVVGDVTNKGLLLFDLYNGGNPTLQRWPDDVNFAPWDMAATPDGGLLILDREHSTYWALDCHLRLAGDIRDDEVSFRPAKYGCCKRRVRKVVYPHGYPLRKGDNGAPISAISIEPGPDGHVLILETDPLQTASAIYVYDGAEQLQAFSLGDDENEVEVMDSLVGEGIPAFYAVIGHDFAYIEDGGQAAQVPGGCNCIDTSSAGAANLRHMIYVADHKGKQVFGFRFSLDKDTRKHRLRDERDFLPLRRWGGKSIVVVDGQIHYDFKDERWVPLMIFAECHYVGLGILTTPMNFTTNSDDAEAFSMSLNGASASSAAPVVPGAPFDSNSIGCTWHRLMLDAQIPLGSEIIIRARAADDPLLLPLTHWSAQPTLYLRSGGPELPFYDPWHDVQPLPERTGTWELLFQEIRGRYLQLELTIRGTGRSTPAIHALRAWYPRFSYLEHYLPAVYSEDPLGASFLDRWLANFEGLYTNLEDKIEHIAELFDPRTAPAEALAWLACWFGFLLDPLWDEQRRRVLIRNIDQLYRRRGTSAGVEIAVRLYIDSNVDDSLFNPRCLGTGSVRIVEHFLTRDVGGLPYGLYGGPTGAGAQSVDGEGLGAPRAASQTGQSVEESAHRFTVLVPQGLSDEQLEMVRRIVELEKPAHTAFELNRYWEFFRVGEARLGHDTRLGESYQFTQQPLGDAYLGDTYLDIPYPVNVTDRLVFNRDDLGHNLPPL
jgi:phage tail-like protein